MYEDLTSGRSKENWQPLQARSSGHSHSVDPRIPKLIEVDGRMDTSDVLDRITDYLLDPVTGSPAHNKRVIGVLCIHVDDLFFTGTRECCKLLEKELCADFKIGSLDTNDVMFTGQRVRWHGNVLEVDQSRCIEELTEV